MEEITLKGGILTFKKRLKRNETYKVSKSSKFTSVSIYRKPQLLKGMASYCEDGKHVLFIDFDNVPRWLVEQDYSRLQEEYSLPQAYLFSTKECVWDEEKVGNYHIICLCKFYPSEVYEMLSKTHADVNFMSMPLRRVFRNWVLRISTKKRKDRPKFIGVIGSTFPTRSCFRKTSLPHFEFLKKVYNIPYMNNQYFDKCKKIYLQEYEAS